MGPSVYAGFQAKDGGGRWDAAALDRGNCPTAKKSAARNEQNVRFGSVIAELTSSQVRENLAELIDNTQRSGEPVGLTRYGRPVAVVLDHALFERLVAADDETSDRQALARALTISIYNSFSFGSSKYRTYLADQPISWTQARNHALILGGDYDLVSINSTEENIAIFNQIEPTLNAALWGTDILCCGGGEYLTGPWIGLFQPPDSTEPAGNWQWVDGTS
ncbi:hypothetical protein LBMAG40_09830 [Cyanobium sp.]|nr:hypothetical protein LBMAG40_09830 [Cyanobium sp.]